MEMIDKYNELIEQSKYDEAKGKKSSINKCKLQVEKIKKF